MLLSSWLLWSRVRDSEEWPSPTYRFCVKHSAPEELGVLLMRSCAQRLAFLLGSQERRKKWEKEFEN